MIAIKRATGIPGLINAIKCVVDAISIAAMMCTGPINARKCAFDQVRWMMPNNYSIM